MRFGGYPLSFRLPGRLRELRNRLSRARYFRGHGVHSPFVYDIVREVFMRDGLLPGDRTVYEALTAAGSPGGVPCNCKIWRSTAVTVRLA